MPVAGQNLREPFLPHGLHRNAIRQAVTLVRPAPVQLKSCLKGIVALRDHPHGWVVQYRLYVQCHFPTQEFWCLAEKCQLFAENLLGRDKVGRHQFGAFMTGILGKRQGNPIERVGKDRLH